MLWAFSLLGHLSGSFRSRSVQIIIRFLLLRAVQHALLFRTGYVYSCLWSRFSCASDFSSTKSSTVAGTSILLTLSKLEGPSVPIKLLWKWLTMQPAISAWRPSQLGPIWPWTIYLGKKILSFDPYTNANSTRSALYAESSLVFWSILKDWFTGLWLYGNCDPAILSHPLRNTQGTSLVSSLLLDAYLTIPLEEGRRTLQENWREAWRPRFRLKEPNSSFRISRGKRTDPFYSNSNTALDSVIALLRFFFYFMNQMSGCDELIKLLECYV